MNPKQLVRLSNIIGTIAIILLLYWVFIFVSVNVFGWKVFKRYLSDSFQMSILGIFALMGGALIINIMFNLTRIAQKLNQDPEAPFQQRSRVRKAVWLFILSFPAIFLFLYTGDRLNTRQREKELIHSARSIITENHSKLDRLLNYSFDSSWIAQTEGLISVLSKTDPDFPSITVIVPDTVRGSNVLLGFPGREFDLELDTGRLVKKEDFLWRAREKDRSYINDVFDGKGQEIRFRAAEGEYELFYPYINGPKKIVLYFSESASSYGKIGS